MPGMYNRHWCMLCHTFDVTLQLSDQEQCRNIREVLHYRTPYEKTNVICRELKFQVSVQSVCGCNFPRR